MTRECMDCRVSMGEKCPGCGTENVTSYLKTRDPEYPDEVVRMFVCQNALCPGADGAMKFQFEKGQGPKGMQNVTTTGICKKCLDIRMGKLNGKNSSAVPLR